MDPAVLILAASNIAAVVVASWLERRETKRIANELQKNSVMTEHTMTIVNNQRTLMLQKIASLEALLEAKK